MVLGPSYDPIIAFELSRMCSKRREHNLGKYTLFGRLWVKCLFATVVHSLEPHPLAPEVRVQASHPLV